MTLSKSWGYGVRALVHLASTHHDANYRWQAESLAEAGNLPSSFLSKVLSQLASAGLLSSSRGRGGGVRLARDPREIRLYDIATATEESLTFDLDDAGFEDASESIRVALDKRWAPYQRGLVEFLTETTLADLLENGMD